MAGRPSKRTTSGTPRSPGIHGSRHLVEHRMSERLGAAPAVRAGRIMVTLPSRAAADAPAPRDSRPGSAPATSASSSRSRPAGPSRPCRPCCSRRCAAGHAVAGRDHGCRHGRAGGVRDARREAAPPRCDAHARRRPEAHGIAPGEEAIAAPRHRLLAPTAIVVIRRPRPDAGGKKDGRGEPGRKRGEHEAADRTAAHAVGSRPTSLVNALRDAL